METLDLMVEDKSGSTQRGMNLAQYFRDNASKHTSYLRIAEQLEKVYSLGIQDLYADGQRS